MLQIRIKTLAILLCLALSGCSTMVTSAVADQIKQNKNAESTPMISVSDQSKVPANKSLIKNIYIESNDVTCQKDTFSTEETANFYDALKTSLIQAKLGNIEGNSRYRLKAKIISLTSPIIALDIKITISVEYTLIDLHTNKEIFTKIITTNKTATTNDSIMAVKRARIAKEMAAQENIHELIDNLYSLHILPTLN